MEYVVNVSNATVVREGDWVHKGDDGSGGIKYRFHPWSVGDGKLVEEAKDL